MIVACKDGTLDVSGTFGLRQAKPGYGRSATEIFVPFSEGLISGEKTVTTTGVSLGERGPYGKS